MQRAAYVLGVHRQPRRQVEAALGGQRAQPVQGGPRALGVHVVGRQRGDAAPVVDAGLQQGAALRRVGGGVHEVRRRLHPGARAEQQPRHRDGGAVLVEGEVVGVPHRGVGLGPEVLDDHLLQPAVRPRHPAQREDGLGALGERLADADQQARGEGDRQAAGVLEDPQPHGRVLVGRTEVREAPRLVQAGRGGLQHHPHRRRDGLEPVQLLPAQDAGVQVGQQPGLLEHPHRHRAHVGERGVVAALVEPRAGLGPAVLGAVPEGEQRLEAAQLRALAGDGQDLVGGEVRRLPGPGQVPRRAHERAVVAAVAAQPRDRDEHLGRVGDRAPPVDPPAGMLEAGVPHPRGGGAEPVELGAGRGQQCGGLREVHGGAALGPRDGAAYLPWRGVVRRGVGAWLVHRRQASRAAGWSASSPGSGPRRRAP